MRGETPVMKPAVALLIALILAVVAAFHAYWAFGGTIAAET